MATKRHYERTHKNLYLTLSTETTQTFILVKTVMNKANERGSLPVMSLSTAAVPEYLGKCRR
jgi:hypothetical protein